jgi:nucleotide-binding universal stress UspA family protein
MFKKILVATDGSEKAVRACVEAGRIARAMDSEITIMHVVYIPPMYRDDVGPGIEEALVEDGKRILEDAKEEVDASGNQAATKLAREGSPAERIIEEAEVGGYDLIVVGSSGLGRAAPLELGSVSDGVSRLSKCSLLIVK